MICTVCLTWINIQCYCVSAYNIVLSILEAEQRQGNLPSTLELSEVWILGRGLKLLLEYLKDKTLVYNCVLSTAMEETNVRIFCSVFILCTLWTLSHLNCDILLTLQLSLQTHSAFVFDVWRKKKGKSFTECYAYYFLHMSSAFFIIWLRQRWSNGILKSAVVPCPLAML